jgi:hypothetical protein
MSTRANFLLAASNALLPHGSFCRCNGKCTFKDIGGEKDRSSHASPPHGAGRPWCPCSSFAGKLYWTLDVKALCYWCLRLYINFGIFHSLPLDPTPSTLSHYIAYSSLFIASSPKYLTGVRHFLKDLYPDFDANRSHPLVKTTIQGAKKTQADPVQRKLPLCLAQTSQEAFQF